MASRYNAPDAANRIPSARLKAENGTIWPSLPQTYQLLISFGSMRYCASDITYTFFTRPRSISR